MNKNHAERFSWSERHNRFGPSRARIRKGSSVRKIFARRLRDMNRLVEVVALSFRSPRPRSGRTRFSRGSLTGAAVASHIVPIGTVRPVMELAARQEGDTPSDSPWDAARPIDPEVRVRVAERIADTIKGWIDDGETLDSAPDPFDPAIS